jgi:hypothetical protein
MEGNQSSTRGNGCGYRAAELDSGICGKSVNLGTTTFPLGDNPRAKAGHLAITVNSRRAKAKVIGRANNVRCASTIRQSAVMVKNMLGLPETASFHELVEAIKANGAVVGVFPEDTPAHTPTAVISSGTVTVMAPMTDHEKTLVMPGQRLYFTANADEATRADVPFGLTIYPPAAYSAQMSDVMSQLYAYDVGTQMQNAAVAFLSEGLRSALSIALAANPNEISALRLADLVLNECGFATTSNCAKAASRQAQRQALNVAAASRTGGVTVSMQAWTASLGTNAGMVGAGNPTRDWIVPLLAQRIGFGLPNPVIPAVPYMVVVSHTPPGGVQSTYISPIAGGQAHPAANVLPPNSRKIENLPATVRASEYAQAAIRILHAVHPICEGMAMFDSKIPSLTGTAAQLVALAELVYISWGTPEQAIRQGEWIAAIGASNQATQLQLLLLDEGISRLDIDLSAPANITYEGFGMMVRALKPYINRVSNGHEALRYIGFQRDLLHVLGDTLLMSIHRAADSTYVGQFVGFDKGVIVNVSTN